MALRISQIAEERVENVTDYLSEGQEVEVVVLDVDQRGRIKLSIKELENYQEAQTRKSYARRQLSEKPAKAGFFMLVMRLAIKSSTTLGSASVEVSPVYLIRLQQFCADPAHYLARARFWPVPTVWHLAWRSVNFFSHHSDQFFP